MTITSFKLLIHMVADYSLYWVLMTIRYHGALQSSVQSKSVDNRLIYIEREEGHNVVERALGYV